MYFFSILLYMNYDLVIIGAGPSGLSFAQCCKNLNLKILIIDREKTIGGCHRVRREFINNEYIFTEHGPRVYFNNFVNLKMLLNEMNINFNDIFIKSKEQTYDIIKENISQFNYNEIIKLSYHYLLFFINYNYGKNINMSEFMNNNNFTNKSKEFIKKICIMSDGINSDNYSLNLFFQLINQNIFYNIYYPKFPNDEKLFDLWKNYLEKYNIDFLLNTEIINIIQSNNNINYIIDNNNNKIYGKKFIFAIPPYNLIKIFNNCDDIIIKNSFGDINNLTLWMNYNKYITYISVIFHWNYKIHLNSKSHLPFSKWNIIHIILSDYMTFKENNSKTVISCCISILDIKGELIDKTPNECSKEELIKEVFYQLSLLYNNSLSNPTISLISSGNYYNNNKWNDIDSAFILTPKYNYLSYKSDYINNLYIIGSHTGKSKYKFTTIETAVSNGINIALKIFPELNKKYNIKHILEFNTILYLIIIFIIIIIYKKYIFMKF